MPLLTISFDVSRAAAEGRRDSVTRSIVPSIRGPNAFSKSMPIAAVLLDLEFPATMVKAIPLLARTGGILAHLAEEQQSPVGFVMAAQAEAAVGYKTDDRSGG